MTITVVFDPPLLADSTTVFNSKAFTLVGDLNTFASEANATAADINADVTDPGVVAIGADLVGANTIGTVAGVAANVTTVAGVAANVTTVAGISANVTAVAANEANINAAVADLPSLAAKVSKTGNETMTGWLAVPAGASGAQVPQAQETLLKAGSLSGLASAATARTNLGLGSAAVAPILGTVSQSGGVPTGAIVETGSGANGIYVRYADGTQICWNNAAVTCAASTATSVSWTYPAVFASATQANVKFMGANVGDIRGGAEGVGTSSVFGFLINSAASSRAGTAQWFAIGRWF